MNYKVSKIICTFCPSCTIFCRKKNPNPQKNSVEKHEFSRQKKSCAENNKSCCAVRILQTTTGTVQFINFTPM